ncbi:hypothetical protein [Haloplanus salilacus]|uniref:hypothetical protein n=1 Tax=Haloplanus salilacus TaxID=2949994 RepID=UPI0030CB41FA
MPAATVVVVVYYVLQQVVGALAADLLFPWPGDEPSEAPRDTADRRCDRLTAAGPTTAVGRWTRVVDGPHLLNGSVE